jgi:hypothetical protein
MDLPPFICADCSTGYQNEDQWRLCCPVALQKAGGANLVGFLKDPLTQERLKRLGIEIRATA